MGPQAESQDPSTALAPAVKLPGFRVPRKTVGSLMMLIYRHVYKGVYIHIYITYMLIRVAELS